MPFIFICWLIVSIWPNKAFTGSNYYLAQSILKSHDAIRTVNNIGGLSKQQLSEICAHVQEGPCRIENNALKEFLETFLYFSKSSLLYYEPPMLISNVWIAAIHADTTTVTTNHAISRQITRLQSFYPFWKVNPPIKKYSIVIAHQELIAKGFVENNGMLIIVNPRNCKGLRLNGKSGIEACLLFK
jgi:hypothetical protein